MSILTKEVAYEALVDFFKEEQKPFVLFATGVSCALDINFGMPALENHLASSLVDLKGVQKTQWNSVLQQLKAKTCDFEEAMDQIQDGELVTRIVNLTAKFVRSIDRKYESSILCGETKWPAQKLLKSIFNAQSIGQGLHVATPNYDLLAEYAFTQLDIPFITGFVGGYCRKLDWKKSKRGITARYNKRVGQTHKSSFQIDKHICLYKPHGSLNTFKLNHSVVECDAWCESPPHGISRFMVTPGSSKFEKLHEDSSSLDMYRSAVNSHDAFLFLGFGFNDKHLVNSVFCEKLKVQHNAALVITRDSNPQLMGWAKESPNMWVVCKQDDNEFTRIYNSKFDNWLHLDNEQLWDFSQFAEQILGA
jgi:hypothetical protein